MSVGVPHAPSDAKALGAGSLAFIVGRGRWGRVKPFGIIIRRLCKAQTKWLIPNSSEIRQHFFGLPYSLSMDGARRSIDGEWTGGGRGMDRALIINFRFRIFRNPRIFPIFPKSTQLNPFFRFRPIFPKFIDL